MYALILALLLLQPSSQHVKKPEQAERQTQANAADPLPTPAAVKQTSAEKGDDYSRHIYNEPQSEPTIFGLKKGELVQSIIALVLAVITAIYAGITFCMFRSVRKQAYTMQRQLVEMRKAREQTVAEMQAAGSQTRDMLTHVEKQVGHMQTQAEAATDSAKAIVASERAWVFVDFEINDLFGTMILNDKDTSVGIRYSFRNEGKTPAWIDELCCKLEVLEWFHESPDFASVEPFDSAPEAIGAGAKSEVRHNTLNCAGMRTLDNVMTLYGVIKYRDMIDPKITRTSTFGYSVLGLHGTSSRLKRLAGEPYNRST